MSENTKQALGGRLKNLREQNKLSIRRFALMTGTDKGYLSDIEHGRRSPSLDKLEKIAHGLDMTISELCQGIDPQ